MGVSGIGTDYVHHTWNLRRPIRREIIVAFSAPREGSDWKAMSSSLNASERHGTEETLHRSSAGSGDPKAAEGSSSVRDKGEKPHPPKLLTMLGW